MGLQKGWQRWLWFQRFRISYTHTHTCKQAGLYIPERIKESFVKCHDLRRSLRISLNQLELYALDSERPLLTWFESTGLILSSSSWRGMFSIGGGDDDIMLSISVSLLFTTRLYLNWQREAFTKKSISATEGFRFLVIEQAQYGTTVSNCRAIPGMAITSGSAKNNTTTAPVWFAERFNWWTTIWIIAVQRWKRETSAHYANGFGGGGCSVTWVQEKKCDSHWSEEVLVIVFLEGSISESTEEAFDGTEGAHKEALGRSC